MFIQSYLPFLNCAANPVSCRLGLSIGNILSMVFLSSILYSSLQPTSSFQYLVSPISLASKIFIHTSLFFFEPISPQTASHATVNSSHSNFLPPYPVQPVTQLLRSIIMAQCRNAELRTRSIMLLLLFRQFCE